MRRPDPRSRRARREVLVALVLAIASGAAVPVRAEAPASLGGLERQSVSEALTALGLVIDKNPDGKIVGTIYVVNQEVFSRHDFRLQFLNHLHSTTRPEAIGRELLLARGQPWSEALADESVRNLQAPTPLFFADGTRFAAPQVSSVVAVLPVASTLPGTVDVLAVTRDLWSLRFNTEFQFQKDTLSSLATSVSENNLFGWRKNLAVGFEMDQGRVGVGPTYFDPNLAGSRLTLLLAGTAWYARNSQRYEGDSELISLRYPLYALARRWGAGLDVSHQDAVVRHFCDDQLCQVAAGGATVPFVYRRREVAVDANLVRSFGGAAIQRVTAGYRVDRPRSLVPADFPTDPNAPDLPGQFLDAWAPRSETRSEPYLRYEVFTPRYGVFRELDTFDLREARRLGPLLACEVGAGLPALGADRVAYPLRGTASFAVAPAGTGFGVAQLQAAARARPGQVIDQRLSALVYLATPPLGNAVRVVVAAMSDVARADSYRTRYFLGGDTGLRGYQIGEFQGAVEAAAHAEVRTLPLALASQRFGALIFYDVGHAADSYAGLVPHHDVGLGLRWLIPQLNSSVLRIDWAIATQSGPYTHPGLPGRITAGFMQSLWLLDSPSGYQPVF